MLKPLLFVAACALLGLACASSKAPAAGQSTQQLKISDAYELAGNLELPMVEPGEYENLHNVFRLSTTIVSGSEPQGPLAFAQLEEMGIKTIISVDGKVPNIELAERHGMRYVHIPIRYKGIEDENVMRMAKTFRELPSPFYVHCFHGRHRGPAAAAVGRLALDGIDRERAVAEMRQWSGTSKKYIGLYSDIAEKPIPSAAATAAYDWDFPAARPMHGFRQAMVEIPRLFDNIEMLSDRDFGADPAHPDVDALNEARSLLSVFQQASELPEVQERPADFRRWLKQSGTYSEQLVQALENAASSDPQVASSARKLAMQALDAIDSNCTSCHRAYRNSRE